MNKKTLIILMPVIVIGLGLTTYILLTKQKTPTELTEREKFYQFLEGDEKLYQSKITSLLRSNNPLFPQILHELLSSDFRQAAIPSLGCFPFTMFKKEITKLNEEEIGSYLENFSCNYHSGDLKEMGSLVKLGVTNEQKLKNLENLLQWNKTSGSFKAVLLTQTVIPYFLDHFKESKEVFDVLVKYENTYPYINPVLKSLYFSDETPKRKTGIRFLSLINPDFVKDQFKNLNNITQAPLSETILASIPYVCPKEKWSYLEKMLKKDLSGSEFLSMVGSLSRIGGERSIKLLKRLETKRKVQNEKQIIKNAIIARNKNTKVNCR